MNVNAIQSRRRSQRRGLTLIEITIAVFLLAVSMTATVRIIGWLASERRACERRQCATREAANVMEHLTALPWDSLTAESARNFALSEPSRSGLPSGELSVAVDEQAAAGSKRLSVRVRWRNRAGEWDAPVRLTAWIHRDGRKAP